VWERVLQFLGLAPLPLPAQATAANAGRGEAAAVPGALRQQLRRQLEPTYAWVARTYGIHWP
jgi:hypothetical protein